MGCEGCGTSSDTSKGCSSGSCGSGGCTSGKLDVFDWLSNMRLPDGQEPLIVLKYVSKTIENYF